MKMWSFHERDSRHTNARYERLVDNFAARWRCSVPLFDLFYFRQECDWSGHVLGCDMDVMRLFGSWVCYLDQAALTERNGAEFGVFVVGPLCPSFLLQLANRNVIYNISNTFQLFRSNMSTEKECLGLPCRRVHPDFKFSLHLSYHPYMGLHAWKRPNLRYQPSSKRIYARKTRFSVFAKNEENFALVVTPFTHAQS